MRDDELKAASRDGFGEDWPLAAADLAPAYDRVEQLLEVRRTPLVAGERDFKATVERRWPGRVVERTPRAGQGPTRALQDALRTERPTVFADTIAERVLVGAGGERVTGVGVVDRLSGERREIEARAVVLCASALESTRLLLNSASADHPDGLANSSGALGRYLMDHLYGIYFEGLTPAPGRPRLRAQRQRRLHGRVRQRHRAAPGLPARLRARDGGGDRLGPPRAPPARRPRTASGWAPSARCCRTPRTGSSSTASASTPGASRPCASTPATARTSWRWPRDQVATLREMLDAAGFEIDQEVTEPAPPGASAHEMGTARMGADPTTSVLNSHNQAWDVPNLYVTDAASFTSSGHRNPTLTIMALTVRACQHLGQAAARRAASSSARVTRCFFPGAVAGGVDDVELDQQARLFQRPQGEALFLGNGVEVASWSCHRRA